MKYNAPAFDEYNIVGTLNKFSEILVNKLERLLTRLVEFAIKRIDESHKKREIKFFPISRVRETRRLAGLTGMFQISSTKIDRVLTGSFDSDDLRKIYSTVIWPSQEFQEVKDYIDTKFPEHASNLEKFEFSLFASAVHNHFWNLPPMPVKSIIVAFLNELFHKPIPWEITIWLTGMQMLDDFQTQEVTIKKPTEEDLMIERNEDDPPFWYKNPKQIVPSAILETTFYPSEQDAQVFVFVSRLLTSLKLFRPGIEEIITFENPVSLVSYSQQKLENPNVRERGGYSISKDDFDELKFHIENLPSLIPKEILKGPYDQSTRLAVAYQCYSNALYNLEVPNEVLTEVIRGIESLYLELDKEHGKASRLGNRVSTILSQGKKNLKEIKKTVSKSYVLVRNPTSHGTPMDTKMQYSVKERIPVMIGYLRKSLLILIEEGKDSFLDRF